MENSEKQTLHEEYMERTYHPIFRPLLYFGLARFHIKDGQIGPKTKFSKFYSMMVLVIINIGVAYTLYALVWKQQFLLITESMILVIFDIFHTCVLTNMCFFNKRNAEHLMKACIEMDDFLGADETQFMRDLTSMVFFITCIIVGFIQIAVYLALYFNYIVELDAIFSAFMTCTFLFFIYYDLSLFLTLYIHVTLRARYLNVALMKRAHINLEYIPDQFPFSVFFWNKKFDALVKFHERADIEKFVEAFVILFRKLRYLENCYRFTIFMCLSYITVGTFVTVQTFILCVKSYNADVDMFRVAGVACWCILSWYFQILLSQHSDMFQRQVNQTKLICTYIQLKPSYPDEMFELSRRIIRALENRDPRFSIYGIFYFDTGLLLKMLASMFVYITTQFQFAFPELTDFVVANSATPTNMTLN